MKPRKLYISIFALVLGVLISFQIRSYSGIKDIVARNDNSNIFEQISIIKEKNNGLKKEIDELEDNLSRLQDRDDALTVIDEEIEKYQKLAGKSPVFGSGIILVVRGDIPAPWINDIVNELFNSGAQAVGINNIRISNSSAGLDTLPQGQIWMGGNILSPPYVFNVIGDSQLIGKIINLPGGILSRLKIAFPTVDISIEEKEIVKIG